METSLLNRPGVERTFFLTIGLEDDKVADDHVLTDEELQEALQHLSEWELRDGWLRRTFRTPG